MTKKDAQKQLEKLQQEVDKLRNIINQPEDLFHITTYRQVCEYLNEKQETCPHKKIKQLEKCFNQDWIKDWNNEKQYKWYPYFVFQGGLLVFNHSSARLSDFVGCVGLFKDEKTSNHIGKYFVDIYQQIANG